MSTTLGPQKTGLMLNPASLRFASPTAVRQTFVAANHANVNFSAAVSGACAEVAPPSATAILDPVTGLKQATFTVTPHLTGTCSIEVRDSKGDVARLPVSIDLGPLVYAANTGTSSIDIFTLDCEKPAYAHISGTATGLHSTNGVAVDSAGNMYVTNPENNSVTIYETFTGTSSGVLNQSPIGTIAGPDTGLGSPQGIAVDANGRIYVANGYPGSVTVYPSAPIGTSNLAPSATLHCAPNAVAVDAAGNIYVAEGTASVKVFAANPSGEVYQCSATIVGDLTQLSNWGPKGIAVDRNGLIYVTDPQKDRGSVLVYAANPSGVTNAAPLAVIAGAQTGIETDIPCGVAVDDEDRIYVATESNGVRVFQGPFSGVVNQPPVRVYFSGVFVYRGVAVRSA